jgi:predicted PurR-regulated permease PerM
MFDDDSRRTSLPRPVIGAIIAVGILAGGVILQATEQVTAPLVLALVTGVVLSPVAVSWERVGIPHQLGALLNLFVALIAIGGLLFLFQPVMVRLVEQAPKVAADVEDTLGNLRNTMRGIDEMSRGVADAVSGEEEAPEGGTAPAREEEEAPAEETAVPSVADALWLAPALLAQIAVFAGTLFFFLATREDIYSWLSRHVRWRRRPEQVQAILLEAERKVSRYFLTIATINAGLGTCVFLLTSQLGVPGAPMWGLLAFLANFVLYLGPAVFAFGLLYAGVAQFDGPMSVVPALAYVTLNFIEGQFVTPAAVGRQMHINPLVVFLSVIFGIWLWGPIGGIVAIPILVWLLVLNDAKAMHPEEES